MTDHQIAYNRLLEERRANKAKELETRRANLANESIKQQEVDETNRANRMKELENMRHNEVAEQETGRHNLATEMKDLYNIDVNQGLGYGNINLGYANLAEQNRANTTRERLSEWETSLTSSINRAKVLNDMDRTAIEQGKLELAAREFDLSEEKFELERDIKQRETALHERETSLNEGMSFLKAITGITQLIPSMLSTMDVISNSIYGF